ncbi:NAAT family transporter [Nibribacter koreensis]
MEILLATFSALFSVINPFGAMPVFLTLTQGDSPDRRAQLARRACLYMVLILAVFFLAGQAVLDFFGLRIHDLRIAGGIMIMRAGFELLNSKPEENKKISKDVVEEGLEKEDISFTPLAMPLLSGPGSIAVVISLYTKSLSFLDMGLTILAIALMGLMTYVVLLFSPKLMVFMGKAGLAALSKIMGFIVLSLGVSFIITALIALFK